MRTWMAFFLLLYFQQLSASSSVDKDTRLLLPAGYLVDALTAPNSQPNCTGLLFAGPLSTLFSVAD